MMMKTELLHMRGDLGLEAAEWGMRRGAVSTQCAPVPGDKCGEHMFTKKKGEGPRVAPGCSCELGAAQWFPGLSLVPAPGPGLRGPGPWPPLASCLRLSLPLGRRPRDRELLPLPSSFLCPDSALGGAEPCEPSGPRGLLSHPLFCPLPGATKENSLL